MTPPEDSAATETVPKGMVSAVWRGPYIADFGPGTEPVFPGQSVNVTPDLAESAHFEADPDEIVAAHEHLGNEVPGATPVEVVAAAEVVDLAATKAAEEETARQVAEDQAMAAKQAEESATATRAQQNQPKGSN